MGSSRYTGQGTILGGLPVIAEVSWGTDYYGEGYAEVEAIYWIKHDGTKGKQISQKIFDRAESYDSYFCSLVEQLSEQCAHEQYEAEHLAKGESSPTQLEEYFDVLET